LQDEGEKYRGGFDIGGELKGRGDCGENCSVSYEAEPDSGGIEGGFAHFAPELSGFEADDELGDDADEESGDVGGSGGDEYAEPFPGGDAEESGSEPGVGEVGFGPLDIDGVGEFDVLEIF